MNKTLWMSALALAMVATMAPTIPALHYDPCALEVIADGDSPVLGPLGKPIHLCAPGDPRWCLPVEPERLDPLCAVSP
ncbi:MAG TPA: hypothetical protein VM681_03940 [Candidatus Thermoplasmatota archaeon]|nr:hypothetical protein [Candidatus Thermoplasmatota archaeon]